MNIRNFVNKLLILFSFLWVSTTVYATNKYDISVELIPKKRMLEGHLDMEFHNSTSDTLQELWVHLWPNAYSHSHTPWSKQMTRLHMLDFKYSKTVGYIDSLQFTSNGQNLTLMVSDVQEDVGVILLNEPLLPGQSIRVSTPFKVKLPEMHSRSGYDGSFYSVTQWYPKFAVYENGKWESMSYLEQGEFYSDFADYDVKVTLPSQYIFAASGYQYVPQDTTNEKVTYHVQLNKVHDFAWYASRNFITQQKTIELPSGKQVRLQTYMHDGSKSTSVMKYLEATVEYMSEHVGEYPYDVCTVVEGVAGIGDGMEYPTICNVGGDFMLANIVVHEVVHNWWYGILANNERKEPFLDESMTSYYEKRIVEKLGVKEFELDGKAEKIVNYFGFNKLKNDGLNKTIILQQNRSNLQQPLNLSSEDYSYGNYFAMIYAKGAIDIKHLEQYLGRSTFDSIIRDFYAINQFKHINIEDLKNHFAAYEALDTKWFFDQVVTSHQLADLKVKKVLKNGDDISIQIVNKGQLQVPAKVFIFDKDGIELHSEFISPLGKGETLTINGQWPDAHTVVMDDERMIPERNLGNNYAKVQGLKKWKPLQIRFLGALEDPSKNQLFFTPVLAGNQYDGFMLGLALYNRVFPVKQLEYELVPFFAFKSKQFNWIGNVAYHILPSKQKPYDIEIGLHSKSFTMNDRPIDLKFIKLQPYITASFKKLSNDFGPTHQIGYRNVQIWADSYTSYRDTTTQEVSFDRVRGSYNTHELWYSMENDHALYPQKLKTVLRWDKDYLRHSVEYVQKIRYTQKGAHVHMRLFAGGFYYRNSDVSFRRNQVVGFNISGINGRNDYLYDATYFGRNAQEKLASKQLMMGEGNFKVFTPLQNPNEGKTVNGLFAANFKIDAPVKWLPVQLFFDMGYSIDKVIMPDNLLPVKQFHYDFGFNISLFDEAVEVYFPLLMSDNFKTYYKSNLPKFGQKITFMLDLQKINFHKTTRSNLLQKMM